MESQIVDNQSVLVDQMPGGGSSLVSGVEVPAHIREKLEKRMQANKAKKEAKSLEQKMNSAAEQSSETLIKKISKVQEHNQRIKAVKERKIAQKVAFNDLDYDFEPQSLWFNANEVLQLQVLGMKQAKEIKTLNFQQRLDQAQTRKDMQIARKIQAAQDSQYKHKFDPELRAIQELEQLNLQNKQKQEKAEAKRKEIQDLKIQKAKAAQGQQRKPNFQRSQSPPLGRQRMDDTHAHFAKRSVSNKYCAFQIDFKRLEESKEEEIEAPSLKKPIISAFANEQKVQNSPRASDQIKEKEEKVDNMKVQMPLNVDLQVKKAPVSEKQVIEINETKTMIVGGNKLTFNIAITVNVEPIE